MPEPRKETRKEWIARINAEDARKAAMTPEQARAEMIAQMRKAGI